MCCEIHARVLRYAKRVSRSGNSIGWGGRAGREGSTLSRISHRTYALLGSRSRQKFSIFEALGACAVGTQCWQRYYRLAMLNLARALSLEIFEVFGRYLLVVVR